MTLRELAESEIAARRLGKVAHDDAADALDAALSSERIIALLDVAEAAQAVNDAPDNRALTPAFRTLIAALAAVEAME